MYSFTAADLRALTHGRPVDAATFCHILTDAEAVGELARLLQAQELLELARLPPEELEKPAEPEALGPTNLPDMEVSWDELAAFGEQGPLPEERRRAVEEFLARHFPEALADPSRDTVLLGPDADTQVALPKTKEAAPRPGTPAEEANPF